MIRSLRYVSLFLAILVAAGGAEAAGKAKKKSAKPDASPKASVEMKAKLRQWNLRDHYTITFGNANLDYAVEDSEWRVTVEGIGTVLDNANFQVVLGDGTILTAEQLGRGETQRANTTGDYGKNIKYWSEYPPKDGLVVRHSITTFNERGFCLVLVELGNTGDKPIEIAAIKPVVLGAGGITMGPGAKVTQHRFAFRGQCPQYSREASTKLSIFENAQGSYCLSLGLFPMGITDASADLSMASDVWRGDVVCKFNPPIRLEPGQKVASEPAWLTIAGTAAEIQTYYAWAMRVQAAKKDPAVPSAWVTIAGGATENDLYAAVRDAARTPIAHALVPGDWEGLPGSLDGCTPRYPKNMQKVAAEILKLKMKPGLTVDPLLAGPDGTAASIDGRKWYNLSTPDGMKNAVGHYAKMAEWKFEFYAVQPSDIPDEVLKAFNMTRAQADTLAFNVLQQAISGKPILPTTAGALKADAALWNEAVAAMAEMDKVGVGVGPIQLGTAEKSWDDTAAAAAAAYPGPLEILGNAPRGVNDLLKLRIKR